MVVDERESMISEPAIDVLRPSKKPQKEEERLWQSCGWRLMLTSVLAAMRGSSEEVRITVDGESQCV